MSLASKYTPDELEVILAQYEFLAVNAREVKLEYSWGGSVWCYPNGTQEGFKKRIDLEMGLASKIEE